MARHARIRYDFLKFEGVISDFSEYVEFLPEQVASFNYFGTKWNSVKEAYDALLIEKYNGNATDKEKIHLMGNILYNRFNQNESDKEKLLSTKKKWLELKVHDHDNFWNSCCCAECLLEGKQNNYGRLLMEVRDRIIWEQRPYKVTKKRWNVRYF